MIKKARKSREQRHPGIFEYKCHKLKKHSKTNASDNPTNRIRWCHPVFWRLGGNDHE